jgi:endoglucanase
LVIAAVMLASTTTTVWPTARQGINAPLQDEKSVLCTQKWPEWNRFSSAYIEPSGRVVDLSKDRRITASEGQAYALFFALVAGDRSAFERILDWTEENLAGGNLKARLPAWYWGRRDDLSWGILDENSASDADLWIAYTLAQAGKVWGVRRYEELSDSLSDRILRESTAHIPGLGLVLLPAPVGFGPDKTGDSTKVQLNPSYIPINLLRWWAHRKGDKRWQELHASSVKIIEKSANRGYSPDWVTVFSSHPNAELTWSSTDISEIRLGSYDAIRVYLWLGMMPPEDAMHRRLVLKLYGMAQQFSKTGQVPEKVDVRTGEVLSSTNQALGWALLPYLKVLGRDADLRNLSEQLEKLPPRFPAYYEDALMLFASGHIAKIYSFDVDGSLALLRSSCSNASRPHSLLPH